MKAIEDAVAAGEPLTFTSVGKTMSIPAEQISFGDPTPNAPELESPWWVRGLAALTSLIVVLAILVVFLYWTCR